MRILFLSDDFPPESFGGAGIVAFNLAKALEEKGHSISIITTVKDKEKVGITEYENLRIYKLYSSYHDRWRAYLSLYNPQIVKEFKKILTELKPDIVHAHNIHQHLSYECLRLAKKSGAKVFLTAHDVMLFHYGKLIEHIDSSNLSCNDTFNYKISVWQQLKEYTKRYNPFRNYIIKKYLKYVDKTFAVSDALKDALIQNGIKNVTTIHNGIDVHTWVIESSNIENFRSKYNLNDRRIILFGGRLSDAKGGCQAILAINEIVTKVPDVALLIMGGENEYTRKIANHAKDLGIDKNLIFTGWLSGERLRAAYAVSNVVLVPSIYLDPFPTINLEAMAMKKPVIATCFGGSKELVQDEKIGFIVNPYDSRILAEKIKRILLDSKLEKSMGESGYQRVSRDFSIENQLKRILDWYTGLN